MARKPQFVFVGQYAAYRAHCQQRKIEMKHVVWISSVDSCRGRDLSEAELIVGPGFIREASRLAAAMRERGLRESELVKMASAVSS